MVNELASSTSPYLRAHADNPVEWRMWSPDSLDEAARRDVPLLISIGYSTCHWCHVMAHESFEDEAVARLINERFLPIKIDREELPDIDAHYMNALQAMRGQGGWPMTIFASPAGSPFYAGTYFPPAPRGNLPSFTQVLSAVSQTWTDRRDEVTEMTRRMDRGLADMADAVSHALPAEAAAESLTTDELDAAAAALLDSYDPAWGGFGGAPKFPPMMNLLQLMATFERLRRTASAQVRASMATGSVDTLGSDGHLSGELVLDCLIAVRNTFARIASGGMRDQVLGGIARYSVDRQWFVPHFEKMLYDNALWLRAAVQWAKVERSLDPDSKWLALAEREIDDTAYFLIAYMSAGDRFIAALDADSLNAEGVLEEGAAYVVRPEEFPESAGDHGLLALVNSPAGAELSGAVVAATGIMDWLRDPEMLFDSDHPAPWNTDATAAQQNALKALLQKRPRPARDEKTITEWNSLAITALAEAALWRHAGGTEDSRSTGRVWGETIAYFWEAMVNRFAGAFAETEDRSAEIDDENQDEDGDSWRRTFELRRSYTGDEPGPGAAGLADWAQFITAGLTVKQLHNSGLRVDDQSLSALRLNEYAVQMVERFTSARFDADSRSELEILDVFDSVADEILKVRTSDPVDNAVPSGRAAAAEVMLLLAELGGSEAESRLATHELLQTRDRLLGVYRALAAQAPRGCGYALWQAERALNPVRVATSDPSLLDVAARHPAVTLLTEGTGIPDGTGSDITVPTGAAIVCRGTECSLPATTPDQLLSLLDS